eukprot:scaffold22544_cov129-Isochrysis_galbana.AAC.1
MCSRLGASDLVPPNLWRRGQQLRMPRAATGAQRIVGLQWSPDSTRGVLHLNDRLLAAITFWLHGYGIQQPPAFVDSISDLQRLQADQQRAGLIVMPFR